jgi:hypothetical protein
MASFQGVTDITEWSISGQYAGVLILTNILKEKNIQSEEIDSIRLKCLKGLEGALKYCIEDIASNDLNRSWLKGLNGIVALALATDYGMFERELKCYYYYETENVNHTSFSLSGGNLGSIRLLNSIESLYNLDPIVKIEAFEFNHLFNLNNDHLVKSMLPKGVYNGIGGILELDKNGNDNLLVPDSNWMKHENL